MALPIARAFHADSKAIEDARVAHMVAYRPVHHHQLRSPTYKGLPPTSTGSWNAPLGTGAVDQSYKVLVPLVQQVAHSMSGGIKTPAGQAFVTRQLKKRATELERMRQPDAIPEEVAVPPSDMDILKLELAQDLTELDDIFDTDDYEEIGETAKLPERSAGALTRRVIRNTVRLAPFLTPDQLQAISDIVQSVYLKARGLMDRLVGRDNARRQIEAEGEAELPEITVADRQFVSLALLIEKVYQYTQAMLTVASNPDFKARQLANKEFVKEFFTKAEAGNYAQTIDKLYRQMVEGEGPRAERMRRIQAAEVERLRAQMGEADTEERSTLASIEDRLDELRARLARAEAGAPPEDEEEGEGYKRSKKWIQKAVKGMKKGAFTKQALREGMTPKKYAEKVLAEPSKHTATTKKRAMFVVNVAKK